MKFLYWIIGILTVLIGSVYTLVFTPVGNGIVAPIIEKKIVENLHVNSKLESFKLNTNSLEIILVLTPSNKITISGNFALMSQKFDIAYRLRMADLQELKPLTKTDLYGVFNTEGRVKGDMKTISIKGSSDVASSDTSYDIVLTDFKPSSIKAVIDGAKTQELLAIVGKAPYAISSLHVNADMSSIDPQNLQGDLLVKLSDGYIDTSLMKRDFNITLPKTEFTLNQTAKLRGKEIKYDTSFESNLAKILSSGTLSPKPLKTDLKYEINFKELALLKPITNAPLRGPFQTKGVVVGDENLMKIDGNSDIASSKTDYSVELKKLKPSKVIASIKDAKLSKLLYMVGKDAYAAAKVNVDVQLNNLDPKDLQGHTKLTLRNGNVNSKLMKRDFNVTLPRTTFVIDSKADLKGKDVDYSLNINSNLAKIGSKGVIKPDTMAMDLTYRLNIEMLELLKPITNAPLRGEFKLNGTVKGDKKLLHVNGNSDLASSKTTFHAQLNDFKPKSITADIKALKLSKLLYMLEQPHYLKNGLLNTKIRIKDATKGKLDGSVVTTITKGLVDSKTTARVFEFKPMPKIDFDAKIESKLRGDGINTVLDVNSNILTLDVKDAKVDIKSGSIKSDYIIKVLDLSKLYFATEQEMVGDIAFNGEFKKDKDLDFTAHSKTLDGTIDAHLHNDIFKADLKELQTLKLLHMIVYPEIFKSSLNGKLNYNIALKKGKLDSKLIDGKFTRNQMGDLLNQYAKYDIYKDRFETIIHSDITQKVITSNLSMKGGSVSIDDKKMKIYPKAKKITSDLDIVVNKNPVTIKLRGNIKKPDVKIDASKLIKREAGKAIEKELGNLLKGLF